MKQAEFKTWRKYARVAVTGLLAAFFFAGCANAPKTSQLVQDFGSSYKPSNVYRAVETFPPSIRRVAILPLSASGRSDLFEGGVETLEPVLHSELEKTKRFEMILVTADQMTHWTARATWRVDESLPANFFTNICDATGCDAVLFSQLTRYQPYQTVAIGWKFNLIETPKHDVPGAAAKARTLWSADELLDSGNPAVSNAARTYYIKQIHGEGPVPDAAIILTSPTRYGQYTLSTLLDTLPQRNFQP